MTVRGAQPASGSDRPGRSQRDHAAPRANGSPEAGRTSGHVAPPASAPANTAADLVAALWRAGPAMSWSPAPHPAAIDVRVILDGCTAHATWLALHAPPAERPAAALLAETSRTIRETLTRPAPATERRPRGDSVLSSPACRRLARMEQWLAARAAIDPAAEPAANLCLWVLDHVEGDSA